MLVGLIWVSLGQGCASDDDLSQVPLIDFEDPNQNSYQSLKKGYRPEPMRAEFKLYLDSDAKEGIRIIPDGKFDEWQNPNWLKTPKVLSGLKLYQGESDLSAKIAFSSYDRGLNFVAIIKDDHHIPAKGVSALATSDAVELKLWPMNRADETLHPAVGVHFWLGSFKTLVDSKRYRQRFRVEKTSSYGAELEDGWLIEARFPLSVLTPLRLPQVSHLKYEITIHDADREDRAEATLRFSGMIGLSPKMEIHEAIQRRDSLRVCMADTKDKAAKPLWGFHHGWRCTLPYHYPAHYKKDDRSESNDFVFDYSRALEPPYFRFLKERLVMLNYPKYHEGLVALLDKNDKILSLLNTGVIGAKDPGNYRVKESDAEAIRLPDGDWAAIITHSKASHPPIQKKAGRLVEFKTRCIAGQRVILSIVALRHAFHLTPNKRRADSKQTPFLEEVFSAAIDDCETLITKEWKISKDAKRVTIHDSLNPNRQADVFHYKDGLYRLVEDDAHE